jgi:biotin carboxyl carrier protein
MRYYVTIASRTFEVVLSDGPPTVDGVPVEAAIARVPGTPIHNLHANGRSHTVVAWPEARPGEWRISKGAARLTVDAVDERTRTIREMSGGGAEAAAKTVLAPMPGLVVKVEVEPGQTVKAGQGVLVVEAMKMENELKAPADGVIAEVKVAAGDTVDRGAVLLVLE